MKLFEQLNFIYFPALAAINLITSSSSNTGPLKLKYQLN